MAVEVKRTDYLPLIAPKAQADLVRLSPDRKRVAFARTIGRVEEVCISEAVESDPNERDDGWWLDEETATHAEEDVTVLFTSRDGPLADLAWSPDGSHIACRMGGFPPGYGDQVVWMRSDEPGELGRAGGITFDWAPDRPVLYVVHPDEFVLRRIAIDSGKTQDLAEFIHFRDPHYWPQLRASPDGRRIAFTSRNESDETTRVWLVEAGDDGPDTKLVTWIPGVEVHAYPIWSTQGVSLAMFVAHVEQHRSGLVVLRQLRGHGRIFYEHEAVDGAVAPAWAPDGRSFVFFQAASEMARATQTEVSRTSPPSSRTEPEESAVAAEVNPYDPRFFPTGSPGQLLARHALVRLDLATGRVERLSDPLQLRGSLRFVDDEHLLVDGSLAAHVLHIQHRPDADDEA